MKDGTENNKQVNPNEIKLENSVNKNSLKRSPALKPSDLEHHRIKFGIPQAQVTITTDTAEKEKVLPRKPPNTTTSFSLFAQKIQMFENYANNSKALRKKSQTPTTLRVDPKIALIPNTPIPPPIQRSSRKIELFQAAEIEHRDENKKLEKTKKPHDCAFTFNL